MSQPSNYEDRFTEPDPPAPEELQHDFQYRFSESTHKTCSRCGLSDTYVLSRVYISHEPEPAPAPDALLELLKECREISQTLYDMKRGQRLVARLDAEIARQGKKA